MPVMAFRRRGLYMAHVWAVKHLRRGQRRSRGCSHLGAPYSVFYVAKDCAGRRLCSSLHGLAVAHSTVSSPPAPAVVGAFGGQQGGRQDALRKFSSKSSGVSLGPERAWRPGGKGWRPSASLASLPARGGQEGFRHPWPSQRPPSRCRGRPTHRVRRPCGWPS